MLFEMQLNFPWIDNENQTLILSHVKSNLWLVCWNVLEWSLVHKPRYDPVYLFEMDELCTAEDITLIL